MGIHSDSVLISLCFTERLGRGPINRQNRQSERHSQHFLSVSLPLPFPPIPKFLHLLDPFVLRSAFSLARLVMSCGNSFAL